GRLAAALDDSRQAIAFADRSGDAFETRIHLTTAAEALHQAGRWAEAGSLFAEAERRQAVRQPTFPRLYSVQGFRYADWLLALAERGAWGCVLASGGDGRSPFPAQPEARTLHVAALDACAEGEERATQTLGWATTYGDGPLLDIALDYLTLARSA